MWKPVVGYEDAYEVSDCGQVRSIQRCISYQRYEYQTDTYREITSTIKAQILKSSDNGQGYQTVVLRKDNKNHDVLIHRLVATAFIPNPNNLSDVNHIDGNKQNNNVCNLEWCTRSDNILHAFQLGLHVISEEQRSKFRERMSKPVICLDNGQVYASRSAAAQALGVSVDHILSSIRRHGAVSTRGPKSSPRYRFIELSEKDQYTIDTELLSCPEFSARSVRDIGTGQIYPSASAFCTATDIDEQLVRYALKHYNGYIPRHNICLRDSGWVSTYTPCSLEDDQEYRQIGLLLAIRANYKHVIHECTTDNWFPTAVSCETYFHIPAGCVSECIRERGGVYLKHHLQFERILTSEVSDKILLRFEQHYVSAFSKRSGGVYHAS